jgi:hypothetical protein
VPLLPIHKLQVIDAAAAIRGRRRGLSAADLHAHGDLLRELYVRLRWQRLNVRLPVLQNTDGEELVLQRLELRVDDAEAALAKLSSLDVMRSQEELAEEVERDAAGRLVRAHLLWRKRGNAKMRHWDNTILGHLALEGTNLTVEVNSNERARRIRKEVERRLGRGVRFVRGVVTSVEAAMEEASRRKPDAARAREQAELMSDPALREALREHLERHYRSWVDERIPALGGKTPRQAVKTADGRAKVEVLLADAERRKVSADPGFRLDLGAVRKELGLPDDR